MDSEELVALSWRRYGGDKISFVHNARYSFKDREGEDFSSVKLEGYNLSEAFQIKTSNNGKTVGVVLSFLGHNENCVSPRMEKIIREHKRKHGHVQCILFVAKCCKQLSEDAILRRIWKETQLIFQKLQHQKKHRNAGIRPLAFIKNPCYNTHG